MISTILGSGAIESGNLLLMGSRAVDKRDWLKQSQALIEAGKSTLKATRAKNADQVLAAGEAVNESCDSCHRNYQRLPLFLHPGWTSSPLWIYVLIVTGQSFILTYATNLARFGIITPIAMHATFNTVSRFLGGLFADTQPSGLIPFELVMAGCGVATALVLVLATRGNLAYREDCVHAPDVSAVT